MEFKLSIIVRKEGKFFVAQGIEIELASQGKTVEDALHNLKEAFELWLKHAGPNELEQFKKIESPLVTQIAVAA